MKVSAKKIIEVLDDIYPNAKCELNHESNFQLLIAVVLSAQTSDKAVNLVTNELFKKYSDAFALSKANIEDVERIIKPIGLYRNKAKNIIALSKILVDKYNGEVINDREVLESLPGVGRKTCNIILNNCFNVETFAVDTHVSRVAKRLGIVEDNDSVEIIEKKLMDYFPSAKWGKLHHQFIFFGRYKCKSIKPECESCPFKKCNYFE